METPPRLTPARRPEPTSNGDLPAIRELLEAERRHNDELKEQLAFLRRQLEDAESARRQLMQHLDSQQQQLVIEQVKRVLDGHQEPVVRTPG